MEAIGIDIGTTSICGVVINTENGEVLNSISQNSNAFLQTENDFEKIQSVEKIMEIAFDILNSLITDKTAVIGITGQMHGIVYTNALGVAVSPLYTWQDGRGNLPYKNGVTYAEFLNSNTGFGNTTHFYNSENGLVPSDAANYCTIHDYFVMRLCGLEKAVMHISDGASLGNFDLKTKKFTVPCDVEITEGYALSGEYNGIPVSVAIGDNQASVLASATENDVLINVGTGSQISVICDSIITEKGIETRPFFENKYLCVGAALCGGRAYAVLKDFYKKLLAFGGEISDGQVYEIMDKMAEMGNSSLKADTRFSGTREDQTVKGAVTQITESNFTPENLTVAVLEGIIDELLAMYAKMGIKKTGVVGSGNGIRKNKVLTKTAEQKLQQKMKIPKNTEEAAVGAAMFGCLSKGIYKDLSQIGKIISYE